jgi:hypothetical protein
MQTQFNKINKPDSGSKDRINTIGCKIEKGKVLCFGSEESNLPPLPAGLFHPYDHYCVRARVEF